MRAQRGGDVTKKSYGVPLSACYSFGAAVVARAAASHGGGDSGGGGCGGGGVPEPQRVIASGIIVLAVPLPNQCIVNHRCRGFGW